ncbi:serine hydrolase domain-containing protein [Stenotrophomonas sp. GZD-301]|uniref:serine hydrolase domain-containing protein n=1 Tax=Stenotrophomonas sp. GZD-301 TaxID=3404814 RepID=UPI003BB52AB6
MRIRRSTFPLALIAAAWVSPPSIAHPRSADPVPADRHAQVDAIFAPWSSTTTPGCAVGIARDGAVDYMRGYGMANLEYDIPIAPDSVFLSGSISKQFTAASVALLAQDGKLSLDDDIRLHLPEMPDVGRTITIAHLIHHSSGLREQGQLLYLAGWRSDDEMTQADMLAIAVKQRGLNFPPGSETLYNNLGYTLLALIVERVSGMPLRSFADARIFKPLGMTSTHFQDDHTGIVRRRAAGYQAHVDGSWRVSNPASDYYGPTGVFTTVGDLLKWQDNIIHARVGGTGLAAFTQTSARTPSGEASGYGGGVFVGTYRGLPTIGHDGVHAGYRADAVTFPDQRLSIVTLCNGASIAPQALTQRIAAVYLGDLLAPPLPSVTTPEAELAALAGIYWSPLTDEVVRVEMKDGSLRPTGASSPLESLGSGVFRSGETARWQFSPASNGTPDTRELRIWDAWPTPRAFTRVNAPMPAAAALAEFAGTYRIDEVGMRYTVLMADGTLRVRWPRQSDLVLEPVGGDRFVSGPWTVTFTRSAQGTVDGLTFTARRLRRMRAERMEGDG